MAHNLTPEARAVWTPERERRAIVEDVSRCCFCAGLLAHGRRRRDRGLLDATDALAWQHAENDAEQCIRSATCDRAGA